MKLIIIGNEKIYKKNGLLKSNSYDLENILEAFKGLDVNLFCRKGSLDNCKYKLRLKFFKLISFLDFIKISNKTEIKTLLISITPFNFFFFLILKIFSKKKVHGFLYLRSDGFKEYDIKYGTIGKIIYFIFFNILTKITKVISCSKNLSNLKKYNLVDPSKLNHNWFNYRVKPKVIYPKILYVGRIKKEKGLSSLISILKKSKLKFDLTIVGAKLKKTIKKDDYIIKFERETQNTDKLISYYDNCNIFILPSYTEGNPQVIKESLSRFRPVIIFNEISFLKKKYYGIEVSNRNPLSLKKVIYKILNKYNFYFTKIKKNNLTTKFKFHNQMLKNIIN